jgi:hypothetical protein
MELDLTGKEGRRSDVEERSWPKGVSVQTG